MKKVLVNAYTSKNLGDDLFLKMLFDRYESVEWIINRGGDLYNNVIFKDYNNVFFKNNLAYKIKLLFGLQERNLIFENYEAFVSIGGSVFMESSKWKLHYKRFKTTNESFLKKGKPTFILGSNFGPYTNPAFLNGYKKLFKNSTDVTFRESESFNLFDGSSHNNINYYPDIVFNLDCKKVVKEKNTIGFSLINLSNRPELKKEENNYFEKIIELCEYCLKKGKLITFFSFCELEGDLSFINKILKNISIEFLSSVKVINYNGDIDYFLQEFGKMENIIGTRFHSVILSQVFYQGIYPIIYSEKTANVLKDLDLFSHYSYISDVSKLDPSKVLKNISKNKIEIASIKKKSEKHFEILDMYLL